jgi:hypothetical protein
MKGPQPQSPAWHRRQRIWRHNSFIGHSVMMRQLLSNMIDAETTTAHTKHLARSMLGLVTSLQNSLQERVDK